MRKKLKYTEAELIQGCINNDRLIQEQLYRRYFSNMMSMCMRYTDDREEALEIINDGFLRVFKKIDTYSFKGSFEGWIRKIVFHSLSDKFKKNSNYVRFIMLEEVDKSQPTKAYDQMYVDDIMALVSQLPPATKDVFCLYAVDGYNHREISEMLGMSIGTSKWHLASARTKLKALINKQRENTGVTYAG